MAAILARELFLYAMTNSLCVVVGGHEVRVVGVAYEDVGALVNCAKYRRKREGGLFSNNAKKKKSAKFKSIREKRVTSFLLNCTVRWFECFVASIFKFLTDYMKVLEDIFLCLQILSRKEMVFKSFLQGESKQT